MRAKMGPTWGRQDPGGPHVGPMNFANWVVYFFGIINFPTGRELRQMGVNYT